MCILPHRQRLSIGQRYHQQFKTDSCVGLGPLQGQEKNEMLLSVLQTHNPKQIQEWDENKFSER